MKTVLLFLTLITGFQSSTAFGEVWKYYIPGNNIMDMAVWGDSVWCVTYGSVVRWSISKGTYVQYTQRDGFPVDNMGSIEKVVIDRTGVPWFAYNNAGNGVNRFDGNSPADYKSKEYDIPKSQFFCSFRDSRGNLWFGSYGDGAGRFDGSTWKTFRPPETLSAVRAVVQDNRGIVWFAGNSLWSFDGNKWKLFTTEDGPLSISVRCITLDTNGAVWFGTAKGVSRFDGGEWKNYTASDGLVSNDVTVIVSDRRGGIWAGMNGGASHFDGAAWKSFSVEDGLISKKVTGIAIDAESSVWFSHGKGDTGLTVYDGEKITWCTIFNTSIPTNDVRSVASGPDGVIWCAIEDGAMSWDGKEWRKYGVADGLKSAKVSSITIDALDRKWFLYTASEKAGATCFDGNSWKTYTTGDGLLSDGILSVSVQQDGVLWFGAPEGASRFDGIAFDSFPKNDRLVSKIINDITEDRSGVMWFATDGGLTRFDGTSWRTYTNSDGLPVDKVTAVDGAPDGSLWLVSDRTLVGFDGSEFHRHPVPVEAGLPDGFRYSVDSIACDKKGALWTGTARRLSDGEGRAVYGGIWRFRDGQWEETSLLCPNGHLANITVDDSGALLFTENGMKRFDGVSVRDYRVNGPNGTFFLNSVCDNENRIWFFDSSNAECFDGKTWRLVTGGAGDFFNAGNFSFDADNIMWYTSMEGIYRFDGFTPMQVVSRKNFPVAETISAFVRDGTGMIWVVFSNSNRLYRFDGSAWTAITQADGLNSDKVTQVKIDRSGVVWARTDRGVCWYDGEKWESRQILNNSIIHFGEDNSIWIWTSQGIYKYKDNEMTLVLTNEDILAYADYSVVILGVDNDNHVWVNKQDGVARYDGATWKMFALFNPFNNFLVDKNNTKWFAINNAILSLDDRPGAGSGIAPKPVTLRGNYPNPFNAGTSIEFDLYSWSSIDLSIYNIMGQKVRTIVPGKLDAGRHAIPWNGIDAQGKRVSSGPYFYRIKNVGRVENGRMMLLK